MTSAGWTKMGPGAEFDLIRRMAVRWGNIAHGAGDDAAVIEVPPGVRLVVSTDTSVEGVHFQPEWLSLREIGYRATTAALSDLAAMAADPIGLLVAATIPATVAPAIEDLADGIGDAARSAGCPIVGGDLTHGDRVGLTITVLGAAASPIGRAGARPGNALYVTGFLGGPAAAVDAFLAGRVPTEADRARFARPVARLAEARWLATHGATAMIDISDGLASEARHLAAASGVTLEIDLDAVPAVAGVDRRRVPVSGEEYELLVAAPDDMDLAAFAARFGLPLTRIGEVAGTARGHPKVVFLRGGRRVDLAGGYDHFST